jgi:hypothetical protein
MVINENPKSSKKSKGSGSTKQQATVTSQNKESTLVNSDVIHPEDVEQQLQDEEIKIEKGIEAFWVAAAALEKIRTLKLYQGKYNNFSEYLAARWGYSESYVSRLITADQTRTKLLSNNQIKDKADKLPKAYSFYYAMTRYEYSQQLKLLQQLLKSGGRLTVEKLNELGNSVLDPAESNKQRLRTAISTIKHLADEFDPDVYFKNKPKDAKSVQESKNEFIDALKKILSKLEPHESSEK